MAVRAAPRLVLAEAKAFRQYLRNNGRRVLGVDVGSYRVGFAIAEGIDGFALPLQVVKGKTDLTTDVAAFIRNMVRSSDVGGLVVGWPLAPDGSEGSSCRRVARFMRQVSRTANIALPYTYFDESNTTVNAYEDLKEDVGRE
jgi:putative transcription antitermination factor YqgF